MQTLHEKGGFINRKPPSIIIPYCDPFQTGIRRLPPGSAQAVRND
jgi:hypothetical protein